MRSVLEELYLGNIQPDSRTYPPDSPYGKAAELRRRNLEALMKLLNDSGKETFEKYCDAQTDMEDIARYDTFSYALKLGILLMTEVFMNSSDVVGEEVFL